MSGRGKVGFQSALLVSPGVIAGAFAGAILAWWIGIPAAGVLLTAASVTGLVSRLWGLASLRGLEAEAAAERETLSVGRSVTVRYTLSNNKALPLPWVEILQDAPERACLVPDDSFRLRQFSPEEAERTGRARAYLRRFPFVMGYSTLTWETRWTGVRRGVYRPGRIVLRSGDGFGLTQSSGEAGGGEGRQIVVWPEIVPVEIRPFLRHVWTGAAGRSGWAEDPTVLRGVRPCQPWDSWKRIDWRVAARTDEIMVRQFDTVTPLSILFVLDAASLPDTEEGGREEAISVTASLIHALCTEGIRCGLALPAAGAQPPLLLRPEDPGVTEVGCLCALAAFEAESATGRFAENALLSCAEETGQVWIVSRGARGLAAPGAIGRLASAGAGLLALRREEGGFGAPVCTFDELRRREGAP